MVLLSGSLAILDSSSCVFHPPTAISLDKVVSKKGKEVDFTE